MSHAPCRLPVEHVWRCTANAWPTVHEWRADSVGQGMAACSCRRRRHARGCDAATLNGSLQGMRAVGQCTTSVDAWSARAWKSQSIATLRAAIGFERALPAPVHVDAGGQTYKPARYDDVVSTLLTMCCFSVYVHVRRGCATGHTRALSMRLCAPLTRKRSKQWASTECQRAAGHLGGRARRGAWQRVPGMPFRTVQAYQSGASNGYQGQAAAYGKELLR